MSDGQEQAFKSNFVDLEAFLLEDVCPHIYSFSFKRPLYLIHTKTILFYEMHA